jgi:hypothetical protein
VSETAIREQAQTVRLLEAQRLELHAQVREAKKAGATIQQLMEWTGYSRRMIFYMLKENER